MGNKGPLGSFAQSVNRPLIVLFFSAKTIYHRIRYLVDGLVSVPEEMKYVLHA